MVHGGVTMAAAKRARKTVRRSISLAAETDAKVRSLAKRQRQSTNRVVETLIETGLEAKEAEKRRFFELAERLRSSKNSAEVEQLKQELAQMTFGS
jgi:hypothetical protein